MQQGFLVQSLSRPHDHDPKTTAIQSTNIGKDTTDNPGPSRNYRECSKHVIQLV